MSMYQLCELTDDRLEELLAIRDDLVKLSNVEPKVLLNVLDAIQTRGISVQQIVDVITPKPKPKPRPKRRPLCSMLIHTGHEMSGPETLTDEQRNTLLAAGCPATWRRPVFLTKVQEDVLTAAGIELPDVRAREIWRGCKNYCQKDLDICAVHAKTRMRQMRVAATLIQSFARMWRAKALVAGLQKTFGQGLNRDVFGLVLAKSREDLEDTLKTKMAHRADVKRRGYCQLETSCRMCPQSWHYLPCFIGGCKHCGTHRY